MFTVSQKIFARIRQRQCGGGFQYLTHRSIVQVKRIGNKYQNNITVTFGVFLDFLTELILLKEGRSQFGCIFIVTLIPDCVCKLENRILNIDT